MKNVDILKRFMLQFQMIIPLTSMSELYSTKACGQGYAGLEKLTAIMNLPKPVTANNYDKIVNRLKFIAKEVANETMRDASEDLLSKSRDQMMIQLLTLLYLVMAAGRKRVILH